MGSWHFFVTEPGNVWLASQLIFTNCAAPNILHQCLPTRSILYPLYEMSKPLVTRTSPYEFQAVMMINSVKQNAFEKLTVAEMFKNFSHISSTIKKNSCPNIMQICLALKFHVFWDVNAICRLPTYGVYPEGEGITIPRNVGNHLPIDTA